MHFVLQLQSPRFLSRSKDPQIPSQVHFREAARHQSIAPPGSTNKSVPAYYPSSISSHCTQTQEPRTIKPVRTLTTKPMLAIYPNIKLIATWKWFSPIRHQNISHATPGTGLQAPFSAQKFHTCWLNDKSAGSIILTSPLDYEYQSWPDHIPSKVDDIQYSHLKSQPSFQSYQGHLNPDRLSIDKQISQISVITHNVHVTGYNHPGVIS